ncbi:hypothetical protein BC938DRAFT_470867 [Jimgerdemannia flammicorona]|uniref:Uncharacterized protein n=1 Tax=Jimgerdemannia flammicorona TaxID=994334 RepID=A0A433Q9A9_9FUNG|nr:hypothetical protein BC938DRAFT_470867 [Jimgerdemannia flammicorona]
MFSRQSNESCRCPVMRNEYQFYTRAVVLFLLYLSFHASPVVAQNGSNEEINITLPSSLRRYSSPDLSVVSLFDCNTFGGDNSVTFAAHMHGATGYSNWNFTMRTVYPDGTTVVAPLPWLANYSVLTTGRLSDGNVLLTYYNSVIGDQNMLVAVVKPNGQVIRDMIALNMTPFWSDTGELQMTYTHRSSVCAASSGTGGGFLCNGVSVETGIPSWAQFDNQGGLLPPGIQTLSSTLKSYPLTNTTFWNTGHVAPTIDGGFLLVWGITSFDPNKYLPGLLYNVVYASFTKPGKAELSLAPFILYETTAYYQNGVIKVCAALQFGGGYSCIMSVNSTFYQIKFLSSGGVSDVDTLPIRGDASFDLSPLYYGGSIYPVEMILYDGNLNNSSVFGLPDLSPGIYPMCVAKNNTVYLNYFNITKSFQSQSTGWDYVSFDLPRFLQDDEGYDNLNIRNSTPGKNQTVSFDVKQPRLGISFRQSVRIYNGNISVFQQGQLVPRQMIPAGEFYTMNDTIWQSKPLLSSTLNVPNMTYYAVMDNGFVQTLRKEPLAGVQAGNWNFQTDGVIVLLKFTDHGREYYNNNMPFFKATLLKELSEFIPVTLSRLGIVSERTYSGDSSSVSPGLYLELSIAAPNPNDRNDVMTAMAAADYLATLISYLPVTNMQFGNVTVFLDPAVPAPLQELVGSIQNSHHLPRLRLPNSRRHGYPRANKTPKWPELCHLYNRVVPVRLCSRHIVRHLPRTRHSLPHHTRPHLLRGAIHNKFCDGYLVITLREASNNANFMKWFRENPQITSIFTILAATDVETLRVLDSQIGGLKIVGFNATFSIEAIKVMFIAGTLGFIFRDIPQFTIMIFYKMHNLHYTIIPFLTLITSGILVVVNLVDRLFRAIVFFRHWGQQNDCVGCGKRGAAGPIDKTGALEIDALKHSLKRKE